MKNAFKRFPPVLLILAILAGLAVAQDGLNPRAVEDLKSFIKKVEEADGFFNQKKYSDAATTLAAAHELYQRAERRDDNSGRYELTIKKGTFPALRYYGYGFGSNASLTEAANGDITGSAAGLHSAMIHMWQDAAIVGGLDKFPMAGALNDPPMTDMSEDDLGSVVDTLYRPVSDFKLPVHDDEWRDVVLWSRRAQLIVEFAVKKYPNFKDGKEMLADIKAKLAEAEPEYAKIVSDVKSAAPEGVKDWIGYKIEDLDKAIAGVKRNGYLEWTLARDIYITKEYVADMKKAVAPMYEKEGKTMPADAMKPLEDKVAELKSTVDQNAGRWKFPGGSHNPTIEDKVAASVKSRFPGATVLKTALDSGEWAITKNDLDIPKYRSLGVLVLVKIPGQARPWLVFSYLRQTYAGGGTYSSGGVVQPPSDVRIQSGG